MCRIQLAVTNVVVSYIECVGLPQKSIIRKGFSEGAVGAIAHKLFEKSPLDEIRISLTYKFYESAPTFLNSYTLPCFCYVDYPPS